MNILRININSSEYGHINFDRLILDISELDIDLILKIGYRERSFITGSLKYEFNSTTNILTIFISEHKTLVIDHYSKKIERDLKLEQLLK